MSAIDRHALVAQAMLAPSVHNVQPARWRLVGADELLLLEDMSRWLTVGDPSGNDAAISLGAAAEGLQLAASRAGLAVEEQALNTATEGPLRPVARYRLAPDPATVTDPLADLVDARRSWRGPFVAPSDADRAAARTLAGEDAAVAVDPADLRAFGTLFDRASFGFTRQPGFRGELLSWMRLSRRHPRWALDGLNAEAMALGRIEAWGAGLLLGPGFGLFDRLGLARPTLAEGSKLAKATGLVVFHLPADEPPFESGRHFYRLWLRIEAAGFGACVLAALADDRDAAAQVARDLALPPDHRVVSAFRIGRRPPDAEAPRARRPVAEILA